MTTIIFILIFLFLVIFHESGHFFAAKLFKVKVDKFAFGFPPKIYSIKKGETEYTFNALPLGGYVNLAGENGDVGYKEKKDPRNFVNKKSWQKIIILSAGVIMNIFLAYLLITLSFFGKSAFEVDVNSSQYKELVKDHRIIDEYQMISYVSPNSPASQNGLLGGDKIIDIYLNKEDSTGKIISQKEIDLEKSPEGLTKNISDSLNNLNGLSADSVTVVFKDIKNKNSISTTTIAGTYGLSENKDKKFVGLSFSKFAEVRLSVVEIFATGFSKTNEAIFGTVLGFKDLFVNLFAHGNIPKDVSGPVGIFNMVDEASMLGFQYILVFAGILSISLAVFNILPFPALDGGRILFVIIESISKKRISEKWQIIINGIGFIILILLMVIVTFKDVMAVIK